MGQNGPLTDIPAGEFEDREQGRHLKQVGADRAKQIFPVEIRACPASLTFF
jgi:hypothetical protein